MSDELNFMMGTAESQSKPRFTEEIEHPEGPIKLRLGVDQWKYNIIEIQAPGGNLRLWISEKGKRVWVYPENATNEGWLLMEWEGEKRLVSATERGWHHVGGGTLAGCRWKSVARRWSCCRSNTPITNRIAYQLSA